MTQNAVHPKGFGLPMRATFALAIFYSGQDATVATILNATHAKAGIYRPHASAGRYRPHMAGGVYRPQNTGGRVS